MVCRAVLVLVVSPPAGLPSDLMESKCKQSSASNGVNSTDCRAMLVLVEGLQADLMDPTAGQSDVKL